MAGDPLESIMGMLRGANSVDPASASRRKADMKVHRGEMGANPSLNKLQRPPHDELSATLENIGEQKAGAQEAGVGDVGVSRGDMTPIIVDQLNETILSLKVQIHRTPDKARRREYEKQAEQIRQQIINMGGDPIYADESVEEGLQKIKGHGQVGAPQLEQQLSGYTDPGLASRLYADMDRVTGLAPGSADYLHIERDYTGGVEGYLTSQQHRLDAIRGTPSAPADTSTSAPTFAPTGERGERDIIGELTEAGPRPDQFAFDPSRAEAPPAPMVDSNMINNLLSQYGVQPMSPDEIERYANAMVDRQVLGQTQSIEREIDRFNAEWPNEFEKAQKKIQEAAADVSADHREDFAQRGMLYSSVMVGALQKVDEKTMEIIGEIAADAARYVSDLHRDLVDIEQWAAVEREIMRHEIMTEERALGLDLTKMHLEVMMHADLYNLDAWSREQEAMHMEYQRQFEEFAFNLEQYDLQQSWQALARNLDHPIMDDYLAGMGISRDQLAAMSPQQQAEMMHHASEMMQFVSRMESEKLTNEKLAIEVATMEAFHWKTAEANFNILTHQANIEGIRFESLRSEWEAMKKLGYHERMFSLDLDQAAANIGLTRAQTQAALASAAASKAQQNFAESETITDEDRIKSIQATIGGVFDKMTGPQSDSFDLEWGYTLVNDAFVEASRIQDPVERERLQQFAKEIMDHIKTHHNWPGSAEMVEIDATTKEGRSTWDTVKGWGTSAYDFIADEFFGTGATAPSGSGITWTGPEINIPEHWISGDAWDERTRQIGGGN